MKTITIITLLVKISNNEELPKKIKYQSIIYTWDSYNKDYKNDNSEFLVEDLETEQLNDEVEIIEDNKIDSLDLDELNDLLRVDLNYEYLFHKTHKMLVEIKSKMNEIIYKVNKGE